MIKSNPKTKQTTQNSEKIMTIFSYQTNRAWPKSPSPDALAHQTHNKRTQRRILGESPQIAPNRLYRAAITMNIRWPDPRAAVQGSSNEEGIPHPSIRQECGHLQRKMRRNIHTAIAKMWVLWGCVAANCLSMREAAGGCHWDAMRLGEKRGSFNIFVCFVLFLITYL